MKMHLFLEVFNYVLKKKNCYSLINEIHNFQYNFFYIYYTFQLIFLFSCFLFNQIIFLLIKIIFSLNYCIISQVDFVESMNDNELKSYIKDNPDDSKKTRVQKAKNKVRLRFFFHIIFFIYKKYIYFIRGDKIFRKSIL